MDSPHRRVRFWEQEGQRWKTLQLKGRKYSHSAVGVGTLDPGYTPCCNRRSPESAAPPG